MRKLNVCQDDRINEYKYVIAELHDEELVPNIFSMWLALFSTTIEVAPLPSEFFLYTVAAQSKEP